MAAYNYVLDALDALDVQVLGLSTDSLDDTQALVERLGLEFPLVCELPYPDAVERLGAYRHEPRRSFQATAFILDFERNVQTSVYSTTNVGRLVPEEVLRLLS